VTRFLADLIRVDDNFSSAVFQACLSDTDGVFNWDITDRLSEIRQPVLVLAGHEDGALPLDAVRRLGAGLPHAALEIIPDVGHYFPIERPAGFNDALSSFLRRLE
jgi:pimeloyl-ACP methyl ester carboxylesterase